MVEEIRQGDIPGVQLRYRQVVPATPQVTWSWLTGTGKMRLWLADQVDVDLAAADTLLLESTTEAGSIERERLTSISEEAPQRWITDLQNADGSWPVPTRLEFELTEGPRGTEVSVLQTGFAHLPLSDCLTIWEHYRRRWRSALTRLESLLAAPPSDL